MKKLYVGCSLTQAPKEFIAQVESLKEGLSEKYEILDFIGLKSGTARDVYDWDINKCIKECDLLLAIADYPAIGLGWELAKANELGKEIVVVAREDSKVTRLLIGAAEVHKNISIFRYPRDLSEVIDIAF